MRGVALGADRFGTFERVPSTSSRADQDNDSGDVAAPVLVIGGEAPFPQDVSAVAQLGVHSERRTD
jgi:hypothetical protein